MKFHLDCFFSAYISEFTNKHYLFEIFRPHRPCQELTIKWTKLTIYSNHFRFLKFSSPSKLLWPLALLYSAHHPSTRFTATEASVLVLKNYLELRSYSFSLVQSPTGPTLLCIFIIPNSARGLLTLL